MPKVTDVCRYVRSKNAGPFWITVDYFFASDELFARYSEASAFQSATIAKLFGIDPDLIKRQSLADLSVVKISYPRKTPQGGALERDMHGGQQYVRLLGLEI
ncbi:MAG: DUF4387 domain-containing protein [Sphingopyxis terrae]|nr:DUF4387 domain-containing protein [Sphingopyxis terrae]